MIIRIIAPRVLLCLGCGVGRAQSSLLARGQEPRGVHWPTPIRGTIISLTHVCLYMPHIYMQNWSKMQHKS